MATFGDVASRYSAVPAIIVYQAINFVNGKRYIGMTTKGLRIRASGHASQAKAGHSTYFCKAIRKHGIDAFEFAILEECPDGDSALTRERELIEALRPEYNTAAGGKSGPQGWKHSEDSRRRMSETRTGQPGPWRGKKRSLESIQKRTATRALNPVRPWAGKKRNPADYVKMTQTKKLLNKPYPVSTGEVRAKRIANMVTANEKKFLAIYCVTDGKAFRNAQECADYYGVGRSTLGRWLSGESKCQRGLEFEYVG